MNLVDIPGGTFDLGWHYSIPSETEADEDTKSLVDLYLGRCSQARRVTLSGFQIARAPVPISDLIGDPYALPEVGSIEALCGLVDASLSRLHLRLPTEDELEVAAGGSLFPWGMQIPDGIPYGRQTTFVEHKMPNSFGLQLLGDPYCVELCRAAFKFGDGGVAICGGQPWPLAWLSLSPAFRLVDSDVCDCFAETLEGCFVRPVKMND